MAGSVLSVKDFDVRFATPDGEVHAVRNVGFDIAEGECLGVGGESGSGKSQLFLGAVGLLAGNGKAGGGGFHRGQEVIGGAGTRPNPIRGSKDTLNLRDPPTHLT